jgi:hypothetical protein
MRIWIQVAIECESNADPIPDQKHCLCDKLFYSCCTFSTVAVAVLARDRVEDWLIDYPAYLCIKLLRLYRYLRRSGRRLMTDSQQPYLCVKEVVEAVLEEEVE